MEAKIEAVILNTDQMNSAHYKLFGAMGYKGQPLFAYAEGLFYHFMDNMVSGYNGGSFDFISLENADVKVEPTGFLPLIKNDDRIVTFTGIFNNSAELSIKAASLVAWRYTLNYIADAIECDNISEKLYGTMQDIAYSYSYLTDKNGVNIFSKEDMSGICKLTN